MNAQKKGSWKTFVYFEVVLYALERMFALEMHWSKVDAQLFKKAPDLPS